MKLRKIGNNVHTLETVDFNILISYETAVACYNKQSGIFARTDKRWSATTSKHISAWLADESPIEVIGQAYFDNLLKVG